MRETYHVRNLLGDYTLGLLPHRERQVVEQHTATCIDCRRALQREQQIGRLVRDTLSVVAQPAPGRLSRLMPAAPVRRSAPFLNQPWQKQLAAACVALILLVGSAGLYSANQQGWRNPVPSFIAITATMTSEPTATLAQIEATGVVEPTDTAVRSDAVPAILETAAVATPSPSAWASTLAAPSPTTTSTKIPTPIAAILSLSN